MITAEIYPQFDANGDGEITLDELQHAMQRLLGEKLTNSEIADVVREADLNGDGTVDFEGRTRFPTPLPPLPHLVDSPSFPLPQSLSG